ncbi:hypothetical protein FEE95_14835 [Maribacter algarum]|uniref:Lipid A 3-O-deacylase (PagL) n=1 Tax=Maribacter algarum (ex Zhang et al. 2020) TaxID=2578118 RepID=A0A5S3PN71_9FLAO|nr:hypothetical protein [Maribacter algarum]TMM55922.1 hypothetical protein FEE95_14835 [Maribacter algarum]
MNTPFFFFCTMLMSWVAMGQSPVEEPPLDSATKSRWEYDAFSYADFGTDEEHSYFSLMYRMNPNLYSELQGFYDSYLSADIVDFSYRVRWYPTKKVYFFSGVGVQIQRPKVGPGLPVVPVRVMNGVGYEPTNSFSIEAVHCLNFNKNAAGQNASSSLFTLKGKYRF